MKNQQPKKDRKKPLRTRTKRLLIEIGASFKFLRKRAGYGNSIDFAINRDIPEGSYGKHEAGIENMTIESLVTYMEAHGLEDEDVFNKAFLDLGREDNDSELAQAHAIALSSQVRHQVSTLKNGKSIFTFEDKDVLDIHAMLIEGHKPVSKKNLLKSIQLNSKTDRFEKLLNFLQELELMQMTDPNTPNSPKQKYYTTDIGKKILRLGK